MQKLVDKIKNLIINMKNNLKVKLTDATSFLANKLASDKDYYVDVKWINEAIKQASKLEKNLLRILTNFDSSQIDSLLKIEVERSRELLKGLTDSGKIKGNLKLVKNTEIKRYIKNGKSISLKAIDGLKKVQANIEKASNEEVSKTTSQLASIISIYNIYFVLGLRIIQVSISKRNIKEK